MMFFKKFVFLHFDNNLPILMCIADDTKPNWDITICR